ncbi:MAG: putative undecaprenyl-phosphate glycosylphosphotransferase [Actinomycetia bacterium]|nr:putative undecaprenyl-phosphate glycosylphosphotransferase [Actinomycetes bacterium]
MSVSTNGAVEEAVVARPSPAQDRERRRLGAVARRLVVVADGLCVVACLLAAYAIRARGNGPDIAGAAPEHLILGAVALPVWLALFARQHLYAARFIVRRVDEWRRIIHGSGAAVLALAAIGYAFQLQVSRAWLVLAGALTVAVVGLEREIARRMFGNLRRHGRLLRDVVIVGSNDEARELATMLSEDPTLGYRVVGFVSDDGDEHGDLLGTEDETLDVVHRTGAGGVIVAASALSVAVSNRLVRDLMHSGIHVELSSTLRDVAPERLTVRPLGPFPVVYLEPRRPVGWRSAAKRAFDLALTTFGLLLVLPIAAVIAVAIKLDSKGPVIFRQIRVGKDGRPFDVRKFRTMVVDAEARRAELQAHNEADGPMFKIKDDPRVTRVGRLLRKTSLDELPQLVNVLRGEMSLVGPRPALPTELLGWDPQLHARLRVKPGITGMWQVSGRSDSSFEAYSRLDLYYVDNWSLMDDLTILAKTIPTVLFGRGAY